MTRSMLWWAMPIVLGACATAPTAESKDRAECHAYSRPFEHSGRMQDACMINRGYAVIYSTTAGWVEVRSKAEPRQTPEAIATDLKGCNDSIGAGYVGRLQFAKCMDPKGYLVTSKD